MKWKEITKFAKAYVFYNRQNYSYEDVQRTLHSELKFNKMKLSLDASHEMRNRHISLVLPNGKTVLLKDWLDKRVEQKKNDMVVLAKHLGLVIGNKRVVEHLNEIAKAFPIKSQ